MIRKKEIKVLPSSFRDPSGFVFLLKGTLYRQVENSYKENYQHLMSSSLYKSLVSEKLLIPHREINKKYISGSAYKIIKPEQIPFISYPYEWCFSQLKDAALVTLKIERMCLDYGMTLKDASAFNIQFHRGKPVFIDTLSFEKYVEGEPWTPYKQFCEHFLGPLSLISFVDERLNLLLKENINGIPLDLVVKLLPAYSFVNFGLLLHLYLHSKSQRAFQDKKMNLNNAKVSKNSRYALIDSLESTIKKLEFKKNSSIWGDYDKMCNYSDVSYINKINIVKKFLQKTKPKTVMDLGANTGDFTALAAKLGSFVVSVDPDFLAIEKNYRSVKKKHLNILPLVLDLTNPSASLGWESGERESFLNRSRGHVDTILALALIHHLVIGNNLSFDKVAEFFFKICRYLIVEFVPKDDSQVQKLLFTRKDIFSNYSQMGFEGGFGKYFAKRLSVKVKGMNRIIYLYEKKEG